ncbi:MAG: S9 family peptidase [Thermomicrobiales bacterium]
MDSTTTTQESLPGVTAQRPLRADDLFRLTLLGDVAVSPDGQAVCFVQTQLDRAANEYQSDLWIVPAGGMPGEAVRFTRGPRTVAQPRWSPNGRWLAFLADRAEKGRKQVWLIPTAGVGGEARALTSGDMGISDFAWAPDSTRLVFARAEKFDPAAPATEAGAEPAEGERVADDVVTLRRIRHKTDGSGFIHARRTHLWTVDLAGHETRLTSGEFSHTAPAWSPDCRWIVCMSKREPGDEADFTNATDLWVIPADGSGAEPRRLPTGPGPVDSPAWSPDGRWIAFVGSDRPNIAGVNQHLWVTAADGAGEPRNLTATLDTSIGLGVGSDSRAGLSAERPVWAPDCASLYVLASVRGDTPLWRVPLDGGSPARVIEAQDAQVQTFSICANGVTLACNLADTGNPGDLYCTTIGVESATPRRLTDLNGELFTEVALSLPESFAFAGAEGWPVQGWLMQPANVREGERYPLVLEIHGGPHAAYGAAFFFEFQLLAAQGYGVLAINPRGSTTYGERFTMASNDDWGGNDYRDLMLGVDAALAHADWIDPVRIGVTGGSFGGYMTNWIITQTDRFKAAVTQRSICNMTSKWGTSDNGYFGNDMQWGGPPWKNLQFYLDRSPLMHVEKVVTPLLIIHSERDLRCPIEQGEQFFAALKYLRRTVEFVRFPDEGHELSRSGQPLHRLERLNRIVDWFARYL